MYSEFDVALLQGLTLLFSLYLFIHGVCTLNFMSIRTALPERIGYSLFTVGVFAALISPLFMSRTPSVSEVLVLGGMVLFNASRTARMWRTFRRRLHHSK